MSDDMDRRLQAIELIDQYGIISAFPVPKTIRVKLTVRLHRREEQELIREMFPTGGYFAESDHRGEHVWWCNYQMGHALRMIDAIKEHLSRIQPQAYAVVDLKTGGKKGNKRISADEALRRNNLLAEIKALNQKMREEDGTL